MAKSSDKNNKQIEIEAKVFLRSICHKPLKPLTKIELFNLKELLQEIVIHTELYLDQISS